MTSASPLRSHETELQFAAVDGTVHLIISQWIRPLRRRESFGIVFDVSEAREVLAQLDEAIKACLSEEET